METWQREARKKLVELLRLDAIHPAPLNPRQLWTRTTPLGTVTKVQFTAEVDADVVGYWCIPSARPIATLICMQGHMSGVYTSLGWAEDEVTPAPDKPELAFANQCLRHNVAALCMESRAFGLRKEQRQEARSVRSCLDAATRALLIGRTLAGERAFDIGRAIEWLLQTPGVDPSRIGILGHSGGGTAAMHAFALFPQLRWCLLSGCFARYIDSIATISHCECNAIPDLMRWFDMPDILAMAAPRRAILVNGRDDPIFPFASAQAAFETLRAAYAAAGDADAVTLVAVPGGHTFFEAEAWAALAPVLQAP